MNSLDIKQVEQHIEIEQKVINIMLKSLSSIEEMLDSSISSDFFDPHHRKIVDAIYEEYLTSGRKRVLTKETYRQKIILEKDNSNLLHRLTIFDQCFIKSFANPNDLGYLKNHLIENCTARKAIDCLDQFKEDAKSKNYQFACKNLIDKLNSVVNQFSLNTVVFSSLSEMKSEYILHLEEARKNPGSVVRCGIPEIDNPMSVGFQPQHFTLFVGEISVGKTNMMLNVALNIVDRGHNVLFIPIEMNRFDLINRILCNRSNVDSSKLARPEFLSDAEFEAIREANIWIEKNSKFCVLDAYERIGVNALTREIEKRISFFQPKVVVIDYADNIKSDINYSSRTIEIGEMILGVRALGKKHGFHIISAAQMNRAAIRDMREGKEVDSTAIYGSHNYGAASDNVFALIKVPGEDNKIKMYTIKCRHGPSGQTQELYMDKTKFLIMSAESSMGITNESDLNLNTPISEIANFVSKSSELPNVDFQSADFDELSSIG